MKSLSLSKPHLIVMVGIPGSGKSFFADNFADTFKAPLVSSGRLRSELFPKPTHSNAEQVLIRRVSDYMLDELFKTHRTIIFEGSSDTRIERQAIVKKSRAAGYEPLFVWVQTESATAKLRLLKSKQRTAAATLEQFNTALKQFSAPHTTEGVVVISGKHTYASQLRIVLKRLVEPRTETVETHSAPVRVRDNRTIIVR